LKVTTKYNGKVDLAEYQEYCIKSIFKILPLMEERKDWDRFLQGFLVELSGINSLVSDVNYISLMGRLEGLLNMEVDPDIPEQKDIFKKTIFDSIDLVKKLTPVEPEG